ncbi:MAG: nicotinate (nicotinamide) nucleotide adenylyltransferase [Kiritimatiellae bacterium]|nr:nicotinate (nicotinamide) nucleotide adenylyltransferase [Kiritimatiellia bacterium]
MKIGIFGGSFDPVHNGHVNVARRAIEELSLDRLLVVPAATSPFKQGESGAGAPYEFGAAQRLMLVRAAFNGLEKIEVDDRELVRGGVSYAIDTVRAVAAENPGAELFFIIGEDSLAGLERWREYDALKELCTFKAYPRTPESSTLVRERLAAGEDISGLVPEAVALFIKHGVRESDDERIVAAVRAGLVRKGGYCPCRLPKAPEFFCPCDEFRSQLADPQFHGLCHCRLYLKP